MSKSALKILTPESLEGKKLEKINYKMLVDQIRYVRNLQHISQEGLAELCDISPSFMGHIERGTRKMSMETFVSIANALHVSTDYLLYSQMPNTDATITSIIETVKQNNEAQYERYITIIRALAEISDHL